MDVEITTNIKIENAPVSISNNTIDKIIAKHEQLKVELKDYIEHLVNKESPTDAYDRAMKGL